MGDDTVAQEPFHTLVLSQEDAETGVKLTAAEDGTEFVLVRRGNLIPPLDMLRIVANRFPESH